MTHYNTNLFQEYTRCLWKVIALLKWFMSSCRRKKHPNFLNSTRRRAKIPFLLRRNPIREVYTLREEEPGDEEAKICSTEEEDRVRGADEVAFKTEATSGVVRHFSYAKCLFLFFI